MNHSKSAFGRYKVIDSLLRNTRRKFPDMEAIIGSCFEQLDFMPSPETIQKDLANMRLPPPEGFSAPIRYSRLEKGYYYDDPNYSIQGVSLRREELDAIGEALEIIRSIGGSRISDKFNHAVEKLFSATLEGENTLTKQPPVLQTMLPPVSRGFEHFDLLYKACKDQYAVSFIHFSYKKRKFNHILLHPFLIKEFDNHWYVIGYSESHDEVRTFGLDRISEPILISKKFIITDEVVTKGYLNDVYGVFPIPLKRKEKIKIHVSQLGTHYFQAYPLHESQKIKKENHGTSNITFELIPSIELARYFLSQGRHVEIVYPKWFIKFTQKLTT